MALTFETLECLCSPSKRKIKKKKMKLDEHFLSVRLISDSEVHCYGAFPLGYFSYLPHELGSCQAHGSAPIAFQLREGTLSTALLITFTTGFVFAKCELIANMFPCRSQILPALSVFKSLVFHLIFKLEFVVFSYQDLSIVPARLSLMFGTITWTLGWHVMN